MNLPWTWLDLRWPWIGLVGVLLLLVMLFLTDILKGDRNVPRYRDPVWLSWLAIPIYMIHQFEEYGIDLLGKTHAFPDELCSRLGLGIYPDCPIPHSFFLFVNIPLVWIFGVIAALYSTRNRFVGLGLYSVIISNGFVHILLLIVGRAYNPGVLTAIVLFLPSFFWVCSACFGKGGFKRSGIVVLILTGIILHGILIGSVFLFIGHKIGPVLFNLIQLINGATILVVPLTGDRLFAITPPSPSSPSPVSS